MSYRNEFDDYENEGFAGSLKRTIAKAGPRVTVGAIVVALLVIVGVFWGAYPDKPQDASENVPIVRADAQDYKVSPDDPGGMQVAHRDSTVFSTLRPDEEAKVENLLAEVEAEEPMPRSQLFAGLNTGVEEQAPAIATAPAPAAPAVAPAPTAQAEAKAETTTAAAETPVQDIAPAAGAEEPAPPSAEDLAMEEEAAKAAAQLEPAAGAAFPKMILAGTHFVQLASIKDKASAAAAWKKLQAQHSSLSDLEYRVSEATVADKGTFYRIQAGPVSKDEAGSICEAVKKVTPGGCLIVAK